MPAIVSLVRLRGQTHTGERPFACAACDRRFRDSGGLAEHARTHTGEKPFPCPTCDKHFGTAAKLKLHARVRGWPLGTRLHRANTLVFAHLCWSHVLRG